MAEDTSGVDRLREVLGTELLPQVRAVRALTREEVANATGVKPETVRLWEQGTRRMPWRRFELLRRKLDLTDNVLAELGFSNRMIVDLRRLEGERRTRTSNPRTVPAAIQNAREPARTGVGCAHTRCSSQDERCLSVQSYAAAIAAFMCGAADELCFAVFGHWGRGKTYLMSFVEDILCVRGYEVIWFSAWRYQNTPQVWSHLYEVVASRAVQGTMLHRLAVSFRTGVWRHGANWLTITSVALLLALLPTTVLARGLFIVVNLLGLGVVLAVLSLYRRTSRTAARLHRQYAALPRHGSRLGELSVIGDDLRCLLQAWSSSDGAPRPIRWQHFATLGLVGGVVTLFAMWVAVWPDALAGGAIMTAVPAPSVITTISVLLMWWALIGAMAILGRAGNTGPTKILLVIDDLDRCRPDQSLAIIEALKLLLDDPEIQSRVQIAMLVEEEFLRRSIQIRYREVARAQAPPSEQAERTIVEEHVEKLFGAFIRLQRLGIEDIREVGQRYLAHARQMAMKRHGIPQNENERGEFVAPTVHGDNPMDAPVQRIEDAPTDGELYTEFEVMALPMAFAGMMAADEERRWGPRTIRCMLAKYQLARLILLALEEEVDGPALIDAFRDVYARSPEQADSLIHRVVRQVC